jgi:Icc-related predicted phosphoesterase
MRIITMSDIHGDFKSFDKALEVVKNSNADVLTINGDLIGSVFEGEEKDYFIKSYEMLSKLGPQIYQNTEGKINTINGFAKFLTSDNIKVDKNLREISRNYLRFEQLADERALEQYKKFKKRFDDLEQKVFLVPGNWDFKCIDDVLAKENISNKTAYDFKEIKFVGYGGSKELPCEIPPDLIVNFDKDEAFYHLSKHEDVEIALMHTIPKGFGSESRYIGEYSLLSYLYKNQPTLILCGHTHEPSIIQDRTTETYVINPGKLGEYNNDSRKGFLEINIDDDLFVKPIAHYVFNGESIERVLI